MRFSDDSPFERSLGIFILLMGMVAVATVLLTLAAATEGSVYWRGQSLPGTYIAKNIFLNSTHVLFTYLLLSFNSEFRSVVKASFLKRRAWVFLAIVAVPAFALIGLAQSSGMAKEPILRWLVRGGSVLVYAHSSRQVFGLSLLFSRPVSDARQLKKERLFFNIFIFSQAVIMMLLDYKNPTALAFEPVLVLALFGLAVVIVLPVFRVHRQSGESLHRPIFLLRLLSYPFVHSSWLVIDAVLSCHGVEYLGITHRIFTRGKSNSPFIQWPLVLGILVISWTILHLPYFVPEAAVFFKMSMGQEKYAYFLAGLYTIVMMHYYLDGCIFRMSDPIVNKNINALFKHSPAPQRVEFVESSVQRAPRAEPFGENQTSA